MQAEKKIKNKQILEGVGEKKDLVNLIRKSTVSDCLIMKNENNIFG